jgi:hypothetical protein
MRHDYFIIFITEFNFKNLILFILCVVCNKNIQCRTFDYDSESFVCRLFEGSIETGQVVPSGSMMSRVSAVHLVRNLYIGFGEPCIECIQSRYLICSSNGTCQCPLNTVWNGSQCINQRYEDANCLDNQWCRNDISFLCSNLHFCTGRIASLCKNSPFLSRNSAKIESSILYICFLLILKVYSCGNMTIFKGDLPGNDLISNHTSDYKSCCSLCQAYSNCRAFTWVNLPGQFFGMCYIKSSVGGGGVLYAGHISAYY